MRTARGLLMLNLCFGACDSAPRNEPSEGASFVERELGAFHAECEEQCRLGADEAGCEVPTNCVDDCVAATSGLDAPCGTCVAEQTSVWDGGGHCESGPGSTAYCSEVCSDGGRCTTDLDCPEGHDCEVVSGLCNTSVSVSCREVPPNASLMTTDGGRPIHWRIAADGACITYRLDANHRAMLVPVSAALEAWEAISCSSACFAEAPADESAAMEFTVGYTAELIVAPTITSYRNTGEIRSATIIFSDKLSAISDRLALHAVGHGLGLDNNPNESSVMYDRVEGVGEIGDDDVLNLCLLYGASPLCDELPAQR